MREGSFGHLTTALAWLALCGACARPSATTPAAPSEDGRVAVAELLAADRAYAAASSRTDPGAGLAPMFADGAVMPAPGHFAEGRAAIMALLAGAPDTAGTRIDWTPVRGGISADGQQGFTLGYATARRTDGTSAPFKYLAYWVKSSGGWHIVAYRRGRRPGGDTPVAPMAPSVPLRMVRPTADSALVRAFRSSLDSAERAFSRDAQTMGLGPAFARYGRPDAVNMGGARRDAFVVGADSIAAVVSAGDPPGGSRVSWAPDRVIVASSGDLGVTIGMIRVNQPDSAGVRAAFPFFTVWRRDGVGQPWRYIAE